MYCKNCGNTMAQGAVICLKCGVQAGQGAAFCASCGKPLVPGAVVCTNCGVSTAPVPSADAKSKMTAGLLGIFLGFIGVHNFYLGYTGKAVAQLVLTIAAILLDCVGIGAFIHPIPAVTKPIVVYLLGIRAPVRLEH